MTSIPKPYAIAASAMTVSTTTSAVAGAPAWITAAPLMAGIALGVTDQVRAGRRERHQRARQDAADEQLRRLERQAARAVRTIGDPDRRAAVLLQLINAHTLGVKVDDR